MHPTARHAGRPLPLLPTAIVVALLLALAAPSGAAAVPGDFFGITAVQPSERDYTRMGNTGFGVHRIAINWRAVQHTREGGYNWNATDAEVRATIAGGMRPVIMLFGTPHFISKKQGKLVPPTGSRADLREWKDFAAAAAARYGPNGEFASILMPGDPGVRTWVVWNEQNARPFWRPRPNPRDYGKLVKASADAIRSVQPEAEIVLGGMYGYPRDKRSISARKFLVRLYRVGGIKRRFDAVNVHPYGSGVRDVSRQVREARRAMRKGGDRRGGLVVGELGWASKGPRSSPSVVGRKGQAKRLRDGLRLLVRKRRAWHVQGVYVYVWRDRTLAGTCRWCPGAGLVDKKGKSKPALRAVRRQIRRAG